MISHDEKYFLGCEFEIVGLTDWEKIKLSETRTHHKFTLRQVSKFMLVNSDKHKEREKLTLRLNEKQKQVAFLENNNWIRTLSNAEAIQQQRDIDSIKKLNELLEVKQLNLETLRRELEPKLSLLRAALKSFEKEKVKLESRFPNSMTYVRNPAYQGIHVAFANIKKGSGINDDEILLAMDRIESIGLVNVSLLYERWCLLQIIKVLIILRYRPEEGWKRKLISQILDKGHNVSIYFENFDLSRKIKLSYELTLHSGKRPDFVLDVSAAFNKKNNNLVTKRLVMDAKFYEDINSRRHGGLQKVINDLYNGKDYSEGGNNVVFIIHPSPKSVPSRATPQEWSRDSYYGEIRLFDWGDDRTPDHRYGGIYLSPIDTGSYLDHLQRAIGMFLQYGMESRSVGGAAKGALPENGVFCLVCGSAKLVIRPSPNNPKAWWVSCCNCKHFTAYNYCNKCKNRLIKNGEYWSYHAMEPLNPINIKCPSCGGLF